MNTKHFAIVLLVAAVTIAASTNELAYGQSIQVTEGIEFTTEEVISIIIIGAFAGVIRAWQGYDKSPNEFDLLRFANGIRDSILVSIPVAFAFALGLPELTPVGYVMIFFTVFGGTSLAQKARQKSIPSNATPEEIQKILDERS